MAVVKEITTLVANRFQEIIHFILFQKARLSPVLQILYVIVTPGFQIRTIPRNKSKTRYLTRAILTL